MQFKKSKYEGPWLEAGIAAQSFNAITGEWRYQRPETKKEKCHHCGLCALFCPSGCVVERGAYFAANLDYCKGCGICAWICPVSAIRLVREEK